MKIITTVAVLVLAPVTVFADLPGMPAAAADARPADPHAPAAIVQTGPVRGSLFRQGVTTVPPGIDGQGGAAQPVVSFIAVAPAQPKRYRKNDIVTVIIREESDSTTNGKGDSKKAQDFDFGVEQFLQLALSQSGVPTVGKVGTPSQLPEIKFKYANNRTSDASQERQDSLTARLTATVVDVKPNGTIVIEAVKQINVDKEEQVFTLSGICRVEDVAVDNTVLSTQLANLKLSKQTKGEVRDGTKRGWLNQFIDKVSPF